MYLHLIRHKTLASCAEGKKKVIYVHVCKWVFHKRQEAAVLAQKACVPKQQHCHTEGNKVSI